MARNTIVSLAALLVAAVGIRPSPAADRAPPRPNVVFVLTDDQGYGDLSCHGNPVLKTPYLDKLHAESIRLTDFHVAPMCTPTRSELMTGMAALRNGAYCACSGRTFMRRGLPTMPEMFAAAERHRYALSRFARARIGRRGQIIKKPRQRRIDRNPENRRAAHAPSNSRLRNTL